MPARCRILYAKANSPACVCECRKIDGVQIHPVFGIAKEDHLFPLDLAKCIVLDDHHLDRELVLHRGGKLRHQHRKAAIAHESNALAMRKGDLGGNRVGQSWSHGREVAG